MLRSFACTRGQLPQKEMWAHKHAPPKEEVEVSRLQAIHIVVALTNDDEWFVDKHRKDRRRKGTIRKKNTSFRSFITKKKLEIIRAFY